MWKVHRESLRIKLIVCLGFYPYLGWGLEYSCEKKIGARPPPPGRHAIKYWAMWKWKVRRRKLIVNRGCSLCIGFRFGRAAAKRKQIICEGGGRTEVLFLVIANATRRICICPWNGRIKLIVKLSKIAVTRSVSTFRQPLHAPFSSTYQKVVCTILLAESLHISWHLISFVCLIDTTQYFELDKMHKRNGWNFRVSDRYDKISVFYVEQEYATTSDFKFWVVHFKARLQYCTYCTETQWFVAVQVHFVQFFACRTNLD